MTTTPQTRSDLVGEFREFLQSRGMTEQEAVDATGLFIRESHSYHNSRELARVLAVYDLYRDVLEVPGHIVEIGVYRGFKAMLFGHLLNLFDGEMFRRYYGFDTFASFPEEQLVGEPYMAAEAWRLHRTSLQHVQSLRDRAGYQDQMSYIVGDVTQSVPEFLARKPHFKVALLYIDCDTYVPTQAVIEAFMPRMQPGGIVAFDEYNHPRQVGETAAADEACKKYGLRLRRRPSPVSTSAFAVVDSAVTVRGAS